MAAGAMQDSVRALEDRFSTGGVVVYSTSVDTAGTAGAATGSGTVEIDRVGWIEYVYLDYDEAAASTTDVVISFADTPPGGNVLAVSDNKTDGLYFPRGTCVNTANTAITNSHTRIPVAGNLAVAVAECDEVTAAVTVYVAVSLA